MQKAARSCLAESCSSHFCVTCSFVLKFLAFISLRCFGNELKLCAFCFIFLTFLLGPARVVGT